MTYHGYTLTPVSRRMPPGQVIECVEIKGPGRHTWADSQTTAKRAIDSWESARARRKVKV